MYRRHLVVDMDIIISLVAPRLSFAGAVGGDVSKFCSAYSAKPNVNAKPTICIIICSLRKLHKNVLFVTGGQ